MVFPLLLPLPPCGHSCASILSLHPLCPIYSCYLCCYFTCHNPSPKLCISNNLRVSSLQRGAFTQSQVCPQPHWGQSGPAHLSHCSVHHSFSLSLDFTHSRLCEEEGRPWFPRQRKEKGKHLARLPLLVLQPRPEGDRARRRVQCGASHCAAPPAAPAD